MGNMNKAVSWAIGIARDDSHGYDQENRNSPDYDCSSFVGTALHNAGFPVSPYSTTRNLVPQLRAAGFVDCKPPYKKGDIHITPGHHVVMSIDASSIVHASINEKNDITGGKTGDQTGREICTRSFYTPPYGWGYHLRYAGGKSDSSAGGNTGSSAGGNTLVKKTCSKSAASFDKAKAGAYRTTDRLHIRDGAGKGYRSLGVLPEGASVRNYGYYTKEWYLVVAVVGNVQYTGFCHKDFLVR